MRTKQRLTITLSPETIAKVEATIDNELITNRSQAIEHLINQGFTEKIDSAIILAGGSEITDLSKVLKKINGRYLLSIMIKQLKKHEVHHLIICSGQNIDQIQKVFKDGDDYGIKIEYIQEQKPMGTAGAIKLAENKIKGEHFFLIYGDVLSEINFTDMAKFHFAKDKIGTMGIKPRMGQRKYGPVAIQGSTVVGYQDKESNVGLSLINTGLYVFSKQIFDYIDPDQQQYLGHDIIPQLIADQELSGFVFQDKWYDISDNQEYQAAVKERQNEATH
jgi:NDP-sugar pyrophosphorylase family protein